VRRWGTVLCMESIEWERKFLVNNAAWRAESASKQEIWQGWLLVQEGISVRLRINNGEATTTCKIDIPGEVEKRVELESPIDAAVADRLRATCGVWLEKTRWLVRRGEAVWEVDEYHGELEGLIVAEIENPGEDLELPMWVGEEVTGRPEWSNQELAIRRAEREARGA
jgi:adenylate cyclase